MALPKPKFKIGDKVRIRPGGGKGEIIDMLRSPGELSYSYLVDYKQRKNSREREDWFGERSLVKI